MTAIKESKTGRAAKAPASLNISEVLNTQFSLQGRKLVNNTGKKEFTPFSPVELPSGVHVGTFKDRVFVKEAKSNEIMYFAFFDVEGYGTVLSSQKSEFINGLVNGAKYNLYCSDPKNGYSVIKKIEKA